MHCTFRWVPGHAVDPEIMTPQRCTRLRFHLGDHDVCGHALGRWWLWQNPMVRVRNLGRRTLVLGMRLPHCYRIVAAIERRMYR